MSLAALYHLLRFAAVSPAFIVFACALHGLAAYAVDDLRAR